MSWFKSYYVVWKPDVPGNLKITDIVFKSYYVVWKRGLTEDETRIEIV